MKGIAQCNTTMFYVHFFGVEGFLISLMAGLGSNVTWTREDKRSDWQMYQHGVKLSTESVPHHRCMHGLLLQQQK